MTNYPEFQNSNNSSVKYPDILEMTTSRHWINGVGMIRKR